MRRGWRGISLRGFGGECARSTDVGVVAGFIGAVCSFRCRLLFVAAGRWWSLGVSGGMTGLEWCG